MTFGGPLIRLDCNYEKLIQRFRKFLPAANSGVFTVEIKKKIELFLKIQKNNIFTNSNSNRAKFKPVDRYLESASIHLKKLLKMFFCDLFEQMED